MQTTILALAAASTLLTCSTLLLALANHRIARGERRRSAARSETDGTLIAALQDEVAAHKANVAAQVRLTAAQSLRADIAEGLVGTQARTIRILTERLGAYEGTAPPDAPRVTH